MKFSSIQGSSSPILQVVSECTCRCRGSTWYWSIPEGGFSIAGLLGNSCGLASRALEGSSGRVGLTSHGSVRGSGGTGGSRSSISRWVLVLERIEVLERHFECVVTMRQIENQKPKLDNFS